MYSSQDLAFLPVPNDSVIASFDLCNYQQLPVLDNICFGLEDGDGFAEDGQQTSESNVAVIAEQPEDLQPPPPAAAVQTPPQPTLPIQAQSPQPNLISSSVDQPLQQQQQQQFQQLHPSQQQQQQLSSSQYVTVLPQQPQVWRQMFLPLGWVVERCVFFSR